MALGDQLGPKLLVVLDDAVVHDRHGAAAVAVGVGVALDRGPMGRPSCVTDTGGHVSRRVHASRTKRFEGMAAHSVTPAPQAVGVDEDDSCGVIAAVFEEGQRVEHHLQRLGRACDADDPAHT